MLQGLFNYDNSVWRFIGKLGDLIILNVLWIVCSIPIFTIGASTTAVYYVTLKMVRDEEDSTIKSFFRSFKSNFKQATAIWLILLAAGAVLAFDFWFFTTGQMNLSGNVKTVMMAIFGGFLLILSFIFTYVFPLQARFYNPVKRTLFNAFFMSIRHLIQTIGILATDVLIAFGFYMALFYMPQAALLMMLFGMPLVAFVNSYFLASIFKRYMPKEDTERGNGMRPLFEDEDEETLAAIRSLKGEDAEK